MDRSPCRLRVQPLPVVELLGGPALVGAIGRLGSFPPAVSFGRYSGLAPSPLQLGTQTPRASQCPRREESCLRDELVMSANTIEPQLARISYMKMVTEALVTANLTLCEVETPIWCTI